MTRGPILSRLPLYAMMCTSLSEDPLQLADGGGAYPEHGELLSPLPIKDA